MYRKFALIISLALCLSLPSFADGWEKARRIESQITEPEFLPVDYRITDYGAVGDGVSNSLPAISEAMADCSRHGGGRVVLPAGKYFCKGTVRLLSNCNLHFEDGAELIFSTDERDYLPCVLTRWEGTEVFNYSPMIYAYNVMNIAITGKGTLNGQGKAHFEKWKAVQKPDQKELRRMGVEQIPVHERVFGEGHYLRPAMMDLFACNTILIEDVSIVDGTFWSFHLIGCSNATVRGVSVDCTNLNSDGVDPESCRNMIIENCYFHTGDDGIAVKSGRDQDGWRFGQPTENVIIRGCTFNTFSNGLCIGSEISSGVRNIFMEDCTILNAKQGLYFKSNLDRGGYIEDVYVRNISVENVDACLVKFEPDYKSESKRHFPTAIKHFVIENVKAATAGEVGIYAKGFADLPIEDITIRNLSLGSTPQAYSIENVKELKLQNVSINGETRDEVVGAMLPVMPLPREFTVETSGHDGAYSAFSLRSDFPKEVSEAVWEEIKALKSAEGRAKLSVRIRRSSEVRGYELLWKGRKVDITAAEAPDAVNALQTLKQLLRSAYTADVRIRDYADVGKRVFMDDVSRGAVPNMVQMKRQIRLLSELKYNALMLYNENIISTRSHPDVAPPGAAITLEEMDELVRYAASYGIEVIGALQSFGHFEKTLALPQYRDMGLSPNTIDPSSPKARAFLQDVISELSEHSSSDYFCVFCDETFDIESRPDREEFYAGHINFLDSLLASRGKKMIVCGDMMMKYPRIRQLIRKDAVIFSWNYDNIGSYSAWIEPFDGFELWVAPGVHSSLRMLPDVRTYEGNRRFVQQGFAAGAQGAIVCTWDESAFHSVENLTYNLSQFAETMWNTERTSADADFRARYEALRFGGQVGATQLYLDMMALADIPMFSALNDRVFYSRFTPVKGLPLVLDGTQLHRADSIVSGVEGRMRRALAAAKSGRTELESWDYILRCYRFMVDSRLAMLSLDKTCAGGVCDSLAGQLDGLERSFSTWWKRENRDYYLDRGLATFEDKRSELQALKCADPSELRVEQRVNPYMGFFLTGIVSPGDSFPEASAWPTPGMTFSTALSRSGRWTKTESPDGVMMRLNGIYDNPPAGSEVRSYARITADRDTEVKLLLGYVGRMDIFLNGERVWAGDVRSACTVDEFEIPLKLKAGHNHICLSLLKAYPEFEFSAYLSGRQFTSNKHRYSLR